MPHTSTWQAFSDRAHRLAERGRTVWRDARSRRGERTHPRTAKTPAAESATKPQAGHRWRPLAWTGGVTATVVLIAVLIAAFWNWDWFRGPIGTWVSAQTHRTVRLEGHIKVHLLTWTPQASVTDVRVSNPQWPKFGDYATFQNFTVRVRLLPLLRGQVDLPLVEIDRPDLKLYSDAQGRSNWSTADNGSEKPLKLPPIQHLIVRDGHVVMTNVRRKFHLTATMQSQEDMPGSGRGEFQLVGDGSINREPFYLRIYGAPLIDVRRDQPYRFEARMVAGPTRLSADGAIDRPFDFGRFHAQLSGSGEDLADLYQITGLAFPNTPPYRTTGQLSRDGDLFRFDHFTGRVGDSDLSGALSVDKVKGRRFLKGTFISRSLDWKDLAQVLGGAPVASKAESPKEKAVAANLSARGRLLPDARLDMTRLRAMDADVRFQATSVKANRLRLSAVKLRARLDRGMLNVDPLTFGFSQGVLAGKVRIDGRGAVPVTDADLELSNYALQNALPLRGGQPVATGLVDGRAHLHGVGASVHEAASRATGTVSFTVPHGQIRQAFAELLGINVGKGLSLLLSKSPKQTDLNCAVADFDVSGGVMRARNIVIDTGVVVSHGQGDVNLGTESLNLRLSGQSKKPRLLRLWAPITVKGTLAHPKLGVEGSAVAAQAGIVGALAVLVHPLAALFAVATPGGAHGANCGALLAHPSQGS